jgi:hypothetical protein
MRNAIEAVTNILNDVKENNGVARPGGGWSVEIERLQRESCKWIVSYMRRIGRY